MMCVLPIHHVNGTIVTLMTPMPRERVYTCQKFHTNYFFKRLADENVQIVSVVPTLLQFLCHDYENSLLPLLKGEGAFAISFAGGSIDMRARIKI
jgi:long-chain acyl-CoA synthetase